MVRWLKKTCTILLVFISVITLYQKTLAYNDDSYTRIDGKTIEFSKVDEFIESKMKDNKIPGLALAIINNSKVIHCKGYGYREAGSYERIDENTVFEAASLGKPIFAYTVLRIAKENLIDLDRPLYHYFEYKDLVNDTHARSITARMVLCHTSGLPNWRGQDRLSFLFKPGEKFNYSGEGYIYLQKVVEKICDKPIDEVIKDHVFIPLQMDRSSFIWKTEFDNNFAIGHDSNANPQVKSKPNSAGVAGTLHTTVSDYSKFLMYISKQDDMNDNTINEMLKPQVQLISENTDNGVFWGLGFGLQRNNEGTAFWHWGNNVYFNNFTIFYKIGDLGVIYFTNSYNGLNITRDVVPFITGDRNQLSLEWLLGKGSTSCILQIILYIVFIALFPISLLMLFAKSRKYKKTKLKS